MKVSNKIKAKLTKAVIEMVSIEVWISLRANLAKADGLNLD